MFVSGWLNRENFCRIRGLLYIKNAGSGPGFDRNLTKIPGGVPVLDTGPDTFWIQKPIRKWCRKGCPKSDRKWRRFWHQKVIQKWHRFWHQKMIQKWHRFWHKFWSKKWQKNVTETFHKIFTTFRWKIHFHNITWHDNVVTTCTCHVAHETNMTCQAHHVVDVTTRHTMERTEDHPGRSESSILMGTGNRVVGRMLSGVQRAGHPGTGCRG